MSRGTFPRVAGNLAARSPCPVIPPVGAAVPRMRGGPFSARTCSGVARDVVAGWENDDDNDYGARRNRSEPNASALGIELTEQAQQLWPTHSYSYDTCDAALAIAASKRERRRARARVRPGEAESTSARASSTRG